MFCILCCESLPPDTLTKARFMVGQAQLRAAQPKGLYWGHVQLSGPPSCVGADPFMCAQDKWKSNTHNSFLDVNDLWGLQAKSTFSVQLGGFKAAWNMTKFERKRTACVVCSCQREEWPKTLYVFMHMDWKVHLFPLTFVFLFSPVGGSVCQRTKPSQRFQSWAFTASWPWSWAHFGKYFNVFVTKIFGYERPYFINAAGKFFKEQKNDFGGNKCGFSHKLARW